jgi:hypothetical protein
MRRALESRAAFLIVLAMVWGGDALFVFSPVGLGYPTGVVIATAGLLLMIAGMSVDAYRGRMQIARIRAAGSPQRISAKGIGYTLFLVAMILPRQIGHTTADERLAFIVLAGLIAPVFCVVGERRYHKWSAVQRARS